MNIDESWFQSHGKIEPVKSYHDWQEFARGRHNRQQQYEKLLMLATGLKRGSIQHYLKGRFHKLGGDTIIELDHLTEILGRTPPKHRDPERTWRPRLIRKIAVILPEHDVSTRYSWGITSAIVEAARRRAIATAVYQSKRSPGPLADCVERVGRFFAPDGLVMVRMTPTRRVLEQLGRYQIPTVLVHSDDIPAQRLRTTPVVARVVTVHDRFGKELRRWASRCRRNEGKFLLVSMPREKGGKRSIRNDRIECVLSALGKEETKHVEIKDYSFHRAGEAYPKAGRIRGIVALADEVAGAFIQILKVKGEYRAGFVVGFDNSTLAREMGFPSGDQQLALTARTVIEELAKLNDSRGPQLPECVNIPIEVQLALNNTT